MYTCLELKKNMFLFTDDMMTSLSMQKIQRITGEGNGTPLQYFAWKIPWMEEPGRLQSMGSLRVRHDWATSPFTFHFHALEKEMATHSSVLAWRIPGMGEPGGCRLWGRTESDGHDWSDLAGPLSDNMGPWSGSFQAAVDVTDRKCTPYHSPGPLPGAVNSLTACLLLSPGLDRDLLTVSGSCCHCSVMESHCPSVRRDLRSGTWDFCPPGTRPFLDPCARPLSLAPSPSHILPHSPLCHSTFPRMTC